MGPITLVLLLVFSDSFTDIAFRGGASPIAEVFILEDHRRLSKERVRQISSALQEFAWKESFICHSEAPYLWPLQTGDTNRSTE